MTRHWNMRRQSLQVSVDRLRLYVPFVGSPDVPPLPHQDLLMHGDQHAEGPIPPAPGDDGGSGFAQAPAPPMPPPPPEWPDETLDDWFLRGFGMDEAGHYEPVYVEAAEQFRRCHDRKDRLEGTPQGAARGGRWVRPTPEDAAAVDVDDSLTGILRRGTLRPRPLKFSTPATPKQRTRTLSEESTPSLVDIRGDRDHLHLSDKSSPDLVQATESEEAPAAAETTGARPKRNTRPPARFKDFKMTTAPGGRSGRAEDAKEGAEEHKPPEKESKAAEEDPKQPEFLHLKTLQFKHMLKKLGVKSRHRIAESE